VSAVASADYVINQKVAADVSAVKSSLNPSITGSAVTFTVTVSASPGSPSGTVTFMDETAQLGSGTLIGASASYTTSALSAGSHSITAVYSGDVTFGSATSAVLTQIVESFSIGLGATACGGSGSKTPPPQQRYTLTVTATSAALTQSTTLTLVVE
jgi:hypothetical protein